MSVIFFCIPCPAALYPMRASVSFHEQMIKSLSHVRDTSQLVSIGLVTGPIYTLLQEVQG